MKLEFARGAMLGLSHIATDGPYFVLYGALLWRDKKSSVRAAVLGLAALCLGQGLSSFLLMALLGPGNWSYFQFAFFCVLFPIVLRALFRITLPKVLYCLMLMRAAYITISYIALNAFKLARPGEYISFDTTPSYTLAVFLGTVIVFPFLWRFCTGRLRDALTELEGRTFVWLCAAPALFFVLDQFYSSIRATLEYESLQLAAIFLMILVTGLATYYISLRTVLDNARNTRLAADLRIKEQTLAADNAALDRLNRMRTELVANISHETKTPLAVLSVYAELVARNLRRKGVDEQTAKDLDTITQETRRIARLMDELQEHIRKQDTRLFKTRLNIIELINGVARLFTPIAQRKNNNLAFRAADGLPDSYACAAEITQVLFNLLQNAHNHTESGTIDVTAATDGERVIVTVSDTGDGIPTELLPNLFERGVSGGGTGLGLFLCKEIIDGHKGEINIQSEPGKGTAAAFTLPVWKEAAEREQ